MRNPVQIITNREDFRPLVTPTDVKTYCPMSANIHDVELIPSIMRAEELVIAEVLSIPLYNKLRDEWVLANYNPANIRDNTQSPDGVNYKELYQQVLKPLVWHSFARFVPEIAIKVTEKGIMLNNSDYSENGALPLLKELEHRYRTEAGTYTERLLSYVKETFRDDTTIKPKDEGGYHSPFYFQIKDRCK